MAKGVSSYYEKYTIVASDGTGKRAIKDHNFFKAKMQNNLLLKCC